MKREGVEQLAVGVVVSLLVVGMFALPWPGAKAQGSAPSWSVGDYWEHRGQADVMGMPYVATLKQQVVGTESVVVGGVAYDTYRCAGWQNVSWGPVSAQMTGNLFYRASDLALVREDMMASGTEMVATFDPPLRSFVFPLFNGETWSSTTLVNVTVGGTPSSQRLTYDYTVSGPQAVTVPAGTFPAFNVTQQERGVPGNWSAVFYSDAAGFYVRAASPFMTGDVFNLDLAYYRYAPNRPPTPPAITANPNPANAGEPITFTASATDPDGDPVAYSWRFGDGATGAGSPVAHAFAVAGAYTVNVTASDGRGGNSWAEKVVTVLFVDRTPPTISNASVAPNPQEFGQSVRIAAAVTDDVGVASVAVEVRGPFGVILGNLTMAYDPGTGEYAATGTFLKLGSLTYAVWALDAAGNAASASGSFLIRDTTAPSVTGAAADPDPAEFGGSVTLSARAADLAGVTVVVAEIRDPSGTLYVSAMGAAGGDLYRYVFRPEVLGAHTYAVTAMDPSGNRGAAAGAFLVRDTTRPSLTAVAAAPDPAELGGRVAVSCTASDRSGIASVRAEVRDPSGAVLGNFTMENLRGGAYEHAFAPGRVGTYAYTVTASDGAGNVALATGAFVVRDTKAPVANAGPDRVVPRDTVITFDGRASTDNDRVNNFTWTFDDGGPKTLYGATPSYRFGRSGVFAVTLTVRDPSGNVGSDVARVTVLPTTGTIQGVVKDESGTPVEGATVRLMRGSTETASGTTAANGSFRFSDVEPGSYTVEGAAVGFRTDAKAVTVFAGQTSTVALTLSRGAAAPAPGWVLLAVVAVLVLAAVAAAFVLRRRARRSRDRGPPEKQGGGPKGPARLDPR